MQVVELDADGVIAHRLDTDNADMAAAGDNFLAGRVVALDLGRGALDAQELGRESEAPAIIEVDLEGLVRLLQANLRRPVLDLERTAHGPAPPPRDGGGRSLSRGRASSTSMIGMPSRIG